MIQLAQDMTPGDQERATAFWRSLPAWRKIQIIGDLYEAANALALADLRRKYPKDSDEQLHARLIERRKRLEQLDHAP